MLLLLSLPLDPGITFATEPEDPTTPIERAPLVLGQGEQRFLKIPGMTRYSLGSEAIRILRPAGAKGTLLPEDALLLKAVGPGTSDLWVWKSDGAFEHRTIRVEKTTSATLPAGLERALGKLEESEVLILGSGVALKGEIHTLTECEKIVTLARTYPKEVHDETEPSPSLLQLGRKRLESWITRTGNSGKLRVEALDRSLWVRGSVERPGERELIERELRNQYPKVELELSSLPDGAPTIHFKVFLLELRRDRFGSLGLGWPAFQEGAFRVTTSPFKVQDLISLDIALQMLEGDGSARVLSNPELVVRAPGEAELFAGGEIPIQNRTAYYQNVQWKNYGLSLKLKVTHSTAEKVRLDILTEVSHVDRMISRDELPGLQTNRMKTQVDARYGAPLLLSGLLQEGSRENAKGLPFLRNIPVLGKLFGSEDYLNERSELVAILLPNHSPPAPPMHRVERVVPKGPIPPPREWISPEQERAMRDSPEFPWNALR